MIRLTAIATILTLISPILTAAPIEVEVSKVTKSGRPLLRQLFDQAVKDEARPREKRFKVFHKVEPKVYICYRTLGTPIGPNPKVDWRKKYVLRLAEEPAEGYADGDWIRVEAVDTGKIEQHEGSGLRVYSTAPARIALTQEAFVKRLKTGEVFKVSLTGKCRPCFGSGRVSAGSGKKAQKDGKTGCQACAGKGSSPTAYLVKW